LRKALAAIGEVHAEQVEVALGVAGGEHGDNAARKARRGPGQLLRDQHRVAQVQQVRRGSRPDPFGHRKDPRACEQRLAHVAGEAAVVLAERDPVEAGGLGC
jgi:hypothetical protein